MDDVIAEAEQCNVATLEEIKKVMLEAARYPDRKKNQSKVVKKKGKKAQTLAKKSVEEEAASLALDVFKWKGHENVLFIIFPNRILLRDSMTRLSIYLEDPERSGQIVEEEHIRPGKHAAALYTGHNFRPCDFAKFIKDANAQGKQISVAELRVKEAILTVIPSCDFEGSGSEHIGCVATSRGLNGNEVADTLIHEAMHGLFYAYESLEKASWEFWASRLDEEQQACWKNFLSSLGYDCKNEELCVNEMLAYLATEKQLFKKTPPMLQHMQDQFVNYIKIHIPHPAPMLPGQYCAFS